MHVEVADKRCERLDATAGTIPGISLDLARRFRRLMQYIRSASDERDFYAMKSLHYEKLQGDRQHQRSMRLDEQFRLVLELQGEGAAKRVVVVGIEDYH